MQEHPLPKSEQPAVQVNVVAPEFFQTLRVPLLRGRDFTERDDINAPPVAIVTQSFVNKYFRGENALGKRIKPSGSVTPGEPPIELTLRLELKLLADVGLVGKPNAGKSALFNALLGHERAVVSPIAGTTRDVLAEPLTISRSAEPGMASGEVMLIDLAGFDEEDESIINQLMQSAASEARHRAALWHALRDRGRGAPDLLAASRRRLRGLARSSHRQVQVGVGAGTGAQSGQSAGPDPDHGSGSGPENAERGPVAL
jgi:hypothetical protein